MIVVRNARTVAGAALAAGALAAGTGVAQAHASHRTRARVGPPTAAMHDSGKTWFSIVRTAGGIEYTAGIISDRALGNGAITYQLAVRSGSAGTIDVTARRVTLYTKKGSLSGTATATIKAANTNQQTITGSLDLTRGTGSLRGDSLQANFSGTADLAKNLIQFDYRGTLGL